MEQGWIPSHTEIFQSTIRDAFRYLLYCSLVMGDIEIFAYDDRHLKFHGYCKYHNTSKIIVTVHEY